MDDKTNEVVEAMAERFFAELEKRHLLYTEPFRGHLTESLRAASEPLLAQARAQAVEDAAKVIEGMGSFNWWISGDDMRKRAAASIRALAQSEGEGKA